MPLIFSYGTLQQENVQLATFGRRLQGNKDALVGYESSLVRIDNPDVIAASGKTHHPSATYTGRAESRVAGTVFEVTDAELTASDAYERLGGYKRVAVQLASGREAWLYVDARPGERER